MIVDFKLLNSGFCTSIAKFAIKTSPWRCCKFPAMFGLIHHPEHGYILFDTGHSDKFHELTNKFPMQIYRWLIHVEHDKTLGAAHQLQQLGVKPEEINYIIISHFHADHMDHCMIFPMQNSYTYKKLMMQ